MLQRGVKMKSVFLSLTVLTVFVFASENDTTLSFEATEGTLISVDVSPNGKTIAFDYTKRFDTQSTPLNV